MSFILSNAWPRVSSQGRGEGSTLYLPGFPLFLHHSLKWRSYQVPFSQPASPDAPFSPKMTHTLCFNGGANLKTQLAPSTGTRKAKNTNNKIQKPSRYTRIVSLPHDITHKVREFSKVAAPCRQRPHLHKRGFQSITFIALRFTS